MVRRLSALPVLLVVLVWFSAVPSGQSGATAPPQSGSVTIVGSVVDASLTPLSGVALSLEQGTTVVARTKSAADGVFRFTRIAPGTYRVRVEHTGFPVLLRDVRVPSGVADIQLPIVLARPGDKMPEAKMADQQMGRSSPVAGAPTPMPTPTAPPPAYMPPPPTTSTATAGAGGGRGGGGAQGQAGSPVYRSGTIVTAAEPYPGGHVRRHPDLDAPWSGYRYRHSGERYARVEPNQFESTRNQPLSTFGADVDTASYSNVRRFLTSGQLPPRDAVRVEEFVNYFRFAYNQPRGPQPLALTTEVGDCPWAPTHKLVLIGARAQAPVVREITGRNLVLLIDVSGSMAPVDRLPLIKTALGMFVDTLQADDRIAIVTYAGTSGVALPSTSMRRRDVIQRAIDGLVAGGSTNGAQGLVMAYRTAREAFIPGGVNRVILATDGDFNVGITSQSELLRLIEREKESGVFLSVFGVGTGNLKDSTMELLADKGNGHYAYLDSLQEARRVLIREGGATLETVAKDVKFQVEFNPGMVRAWKLIGYENRLLAPQDFNNDRKDGGELGAGHTVTVLYEVVPVGAPDDDDRYGRPTVDALKYQDQPQGPRAPRVVERPVAADPAFAGEWLTVKARYIDISGSARRAPEGERSDLITHPVRTSARVQHLPLASAIAEFGLLLRDGARDAESWDALLRRVSRIDVSGAHAADKAEFQELVAIARGLARWR